MHQHAWSDFCDIFRGRGEPCPNTRHPMWVDIRQKIDAVIGDDGVGNERCRS
jgi:hypothetical protein